MPTSATKSKRLTTPRQYLLDKNVILPFFTLQEITAVVQAEITAERKSQVPVDPQGQARTGPVPGIWGMAQRSG